MWPVLQSQTNLKNGMTTFWPCSFEIDNDVADMVDAETTPLLITSVKGWQQEKVDGTFITNPFVCPKFPDKNTETKSWPVACKITDKKNGKTSAILLGDQYAFHSSMIAYSSGQSLDLRSLDFLSDCLLTLSENNELLKIKNKSTQIKGLYKVDKQNEKFYKLIRITLLLSIIIPVLFTGITAAASSIKRRNFLT